jgi:hypothetical protein
MTLTINEVVAFNLMRARRRRGWTQQETAERLTKVMGKKWTKAALGAAERSWETDRVKQFDCNEIAAFCLVFDLPFAAFLLPPDTIERQDEFALGPSGQHLSATDLLRTVLTMGPTDDFNAAARAAMRKVAPPTPPGPRRGGDDALDDATRRAMLACVDELRALLAPSTGTEDDPT